ncbi:hypothetical protein SUGI_1110620 [Cryptomeria japonica]|uniref:DEAD-box ATP-dependent RNA helicase 42 n=1 Tax=Cryptomeria japonica TaxID=3369 RepID=UPI0024148A3B|nr:DEAD-box ATP-dependent RNA helicase 42 [Cryptomeria japonica]GLJ52215.1 hypothetical protein SUGI_1110620 [Cryptomeria japonica]
MEDGKHRSRRDDADRKESYRRSDRERNGEKHSERERHKDRDREKEKEKEEKTDRNRVREKSKEREIEKKDRDYRRSEKERNSEKYKDSRYRDSRDKENDSSKSRHRDDRERVRDKEKDEREKLKERIRDRDRDRKRRDFERVRDSDSDDERDQKRRKREDSLRGKERSKDKYKGDDRERERNKDNNRYRDDEDVGRRNQGDRHRAEDEDVKGRKNFDTKKRKNDESDEETKVKEDMEEEQRRLDEEMEKRRRRVQEWQELRRKKEESENEKRGEEKNEVEPKSGKKWTLEGEESDDELDGPPKSFIFENGDVAVDEAGNKNLHNGEAMDIDKVEANVEEELDPLDAFMNTLVVPDAENFSSKTDNSVGIGKEVKDLNYGTNKRKSNKGILGRIMPGDDSDADNDEVGDDDENQIDDEDDDEFMKRVKKTKVEKLSVVDHSKIQYPPFRKDFYREVREIFLMTAEEVAAYRKELELKIRGKDVPKPVKTWNQTGLTRNVLEVLKKLGYEKPMSIQAQSLPIIMSGRDCIGIAKTGSGKTLAFVLPMLRHIKDQPPLASGDGPIGLIMAPTRELVQQIHADIRKFAKVLGLSCVPVYGGSGVAQQISDLKRGTEIVVCTPGRMIDILCTSGGKITNLSRVTYLVMDEADRMFDMGFEPQITRIVQNTRPDRQTVLYSATFPRQVEFLARKVLNKPVEIQVGGRSVVNKDIAQSIEVRPEGERFLRLLELLGEWYEKGKILVFVHSQEKCDSLFKELLRHGYPCLSLHGAKDQTDRESTISDFKSNVCNLLIATSIAARGLDVKELELVVNFDAPNHYEDYVHRVGRTGRAGRKGVAVTFVSEEEDRYAPDLVKALELSEQAIPEDLKNLATGFMAKVSQGTEHAHGTGYGGSGFKFNEEEEEARKAVKKAQAREYGFEEYYKSDSDSEDDGIRKAGSDLEHAAALAQAAALAAVTKASITTMPMSLANSGALATVGLSTGALPGETWVGGTPTVSGLPGAALPVSGLAGAFPVPNDAAARVQALAAALNLQHNLAKIQKDAMPEHYEGELEINDFPQNARWKVTHKETLGPISEWTGAAITTRGQYYPPGKIPGPGERKLYLFIEGPTESSVKKAKAELKRVLEDYTAQSLSLPGSVQPGKYSVL